MTWAADEGVAGPFRAATLVVAAAVCAQRIGRDASRLRGAAPEVAPAQTGRTEGWGSRQTEKRPRFSAAPAAVFGGGKARARRSPAGARDSQLLGRPFRESRAAARPSQVAYPPGEDASARPSKLGVSRRKGRRRAPADGGHGPSREWRRSRCVQHRCGLKAASPRPPTSLTDDSSVRSFDDSPRQQGRIEPRVEGCRRTGIPAPGVQPAPGLDAAHARVAAEPSPTCAR